MESLISELVKVLFARTDPVLVAVLIVLAVLWYRTDRKISDHIDLKNKYPHPACEWEVKINSDLKEQIETVRKENREDHSEMFEIMRGKTASTESER